MSMSYIKIARFYMIQFLLHIIIYSIFQILYQISEDGSEGKKKLRSWLVYISPFDPDSTGRLHLCQIYITGILTVIILDHFQYKYIRTNRFSILYQLNDPSSGKEAKDELLKSYIDILVRSNMNHCNKLALESTKNRSVLHRLEQERIYLRKLKYNIDHIVPDFMHLDILRKRFLYVSIIFVSYAYLAITFLITLDLRMKILKELYGARRSFLAIKLFFDSYLVIMFYSQWLVPIFSTYIILLRYNREALIHLKLSIEKLRISSLESRVRGDNRLNSSIEDISTFKKSQTISNRLALESYISLRYIIDSSIVDLISKSLGITILLSAPNTIYNFSSGRKDPIIMMSNIFDGLIGFTSLTFLAIAHEYTHCSWEIRRLLSMSLAAINSEKNISSNELTSSHTRLLWTRLSENENFIDKRFSVYLFDTIILNHRAWFTIQYYTHLIAWLRSKG